MYMYGLFQDYYGPEFVHKSSKPLVRISVPLQGEVSVVTFGLYIYWGVAANLKLVPLSRQAFMHSSNNINIPQIELVWVELHKGYLCY